MILDEIVSIKKVGVQKTVDIEVDGDHLFYCNGILTHNSAAGDTNDISEDNIQGGISKIQSADNVLGFIPNAQSREMGVMRAKFLKTRDSSGVGSYVDFKVDWSTLTFNPWQAEGADNFSSHIQSNMPNLNTIQRTEKGKAKPSQDDNRPKATVKSDNEDDDDAPKTRSIIKGIGGKKAPFKKNVKLV